MDFVKWIFSHLADFLASAASYVTEHLNIFHGVDFSVLYSWLPGDIAAVCGLVITFCFVMFLLGLLSKLPFI